MAAKRNLDLSIILSTASELVEETGFDALNINALAVALQVKPPSLYNHLSGIDELRRELLQLVIRRMGEAIRSAAVGRSEENALREVAYAYRRFAQKHPELYRVFVNAPKFDGGAALEAMAETFRRILSAYELTAADKVNYTRLFHSGLHGFISLENAGFFSADPDLEDCFSRLVDAQIKILHNWTNI